MESNTKVTITLTPQEVEDILKLYFKGSLENKLHVTKVNFNVETVYLDHLDEHGHMELSSIECVGESSGIKIPRP